MDARTALALVLLVVIAGTCARVRCATREGRDLKPRPDALEYGIAAATFADRGTFAIPIGGVDYPSRYPVGFPLMLAPFVAARGLAGAWIGALTFGALAIGVAGLLGLLSGGSFAALIAALIVARSPLAFEASTLAMSETASMLLFGIVLAALAAARWRSPERPRTWLLWTAALAAAAAASIRYTNAALLLLLLVAAPRSHRWRLLLPGALVVAAMLARNAVLFGHPLHDGYQFWIHAGETGEPPHLFSLSYLLTNSGFFPASNLATYSRSLAGLEPGLWTAIAAGLASIGLVRAVALFRRCPVARTCVLATLLVALPIVAFHAVYFWQDERFLLPLLPLLAALAGGGVAAFAGMRLTFVGVVLGLIGTATGTSVFDSKPGTIPALVDVAADVDARLPAGALALGNFPATLAARLLPGREFALLEAAGADPHVDRIRRYDLHGFDGRKAEVASWIGPAGTPDEALAADLARRLAAGQPVVALVAAGEGPSEPALAALRERFAVEPLFVAEPVSVFAVKAR